MGFCVRSGDSWAKDSCLSHSFICMTRGGSSVTFLIILLSESALKKEVDRLSPNSQSGPESLLFSQNACSRRHHLCIDTASEGSGVVDGARKGKVSAPQASSAIPVPQGIRNRDTGSCHQLAS